ncbi:hypothetical protein PIB30_072827 [Stylosanthes scabra]|uniref:Uncharacterized protein n=1 Tax=Stylosanthes scabra TaxID=79078 RepID=A0ABU6WP33_9FABA|nr:hypothetical protein [Stylosanthes scabra]
MVCREDKTALRKRCQANDRKRALGLVTCKVMPKNPFEVSDSLPASAPNRIKKNEERKLEEQEMENLEHSGQSPMPGAQRLGVQSHTQDQAIHA